MSSKFKYWAFWVLLLATLPAASALALPPARPGIVDGWTNRYLTTGERVPVFPKEMQYIRPSPRGGAVPLAPARRGAGLAGPLAIGTAGDASVRPLVLLIDFADKPHKQGAAQLASLVFASGPNDYSVKNYWEEVSYTRQGTNIPGKSFRVLAPVAPAPQVVGWLRAGTDFPTSVNSYAQLLDPAAGANLANIRQLVADAILYLDSAAGRAAWNVTFSQYRGPAGPAVQALVLVHPGFGAEDTGSPAQDVYSHQAAFGTAIPTLDGTTIGDYITVPESQFYSDTTGGVSPPLIGAGVIVHEMGHLLGLPDLYPASSTGQAGGGFSGVGVYDLMGYGIWGNNLLIRADVPAHLSAWSKAELGWIVPQVQQATALSMLLRPVEYFPDAHLVYPSSIDPTQWFLVENRERTDTSAPAPPWLFDNFLPGAGILVWHVDNQVIAAARASNTVNNDNAFKGLDLEEANGLNFLSQLIPPAGTPNDRAPYFGQVSDYFTKSTDEFSRTKPVPGVNETNSSPIVGLPAFVTGVRPPDAGDNVTMANFIAQLQHLPDGTISAYFLYDLVLSGLGGGGALHDWKTFNILTTQTYPLDNTVPAPRGPMRSNNILSIAFDSGNNVWMGSSDQGIFRFLGTRFEFLGSAQGLPFASPGVLSPIRAMASEPATGSMWVGTDSGLFKMRDSGAGFRVQVSFTQSTAHPVPTNAIRAIAVRTGSGIKYVATDNGLVRIDDGLTDTESDDFVGLILRGNVTAVAVDDNGTPDNPGDDTVWVGFANGTFTRSLVANPLADADFKSPPWTLTGSPKVTALAIDKSGRLWIGTEGSGALAFDLGETSIPPMPNLLDPYDFDRDGNLQPEPSGRQVFLDTALGAASNKVTGIAFQAVSDPQPVVWLSHVPDVGGIADPSGGATRFNANDGSIAVFRPEAGVTPENQVNGPCSRWLDAAAGDTAGNVWFGSTVGDAEGVSRFGNGGIISLDSSNYVNTSAVAVVTLQDDGLNTSKTAVDHAIVFVTSSLDSVGFLVRLTETGPDTGVFTGRFGFSLGASDTSGQLPLIRIENGAIVTATYFDANPRGVRTATAKWKKVFPFSDSLFIDNFSCFVATAAFDSAMAREVRALRRFRDDYLLGNAAGRAFVACYYRTSPPLASLISRSAALRFAARRLLAPAVLFAGFAVGAGALEISGVIVILAGMAAALFAGPRRNVRRA